MKSGLTDDEVRAASCGSQDANFMARNVSIEKDAADNWKPSKKKSRERIDGIVALIMGLERATAYQESVYNTRGALFITLDDDWVEAGE